ncbi:uncharacterized protein LOC106653300 [Trichogramma pretiosum]|uniref:uncharacterized protein LOC106653300 n=1 Tax=Trichogramma pretiosum TaxID=7493 RepID=UPI000C71A75E|nr:uncharacterized protein LOC106653300 [Trichogramma pretiosum]
MESEELTKLVDDIYKNILEKFNPSARQLITAGKAYLKALHGAAAASKAYVDALTKIGRQAQLGTWGGSQDVGSALMKIVDVYKAIQEQEINIMKAFYVDMLVPLETNLEKDTKVVQSEQKKFLQQHKTRSESYSKAAAAMKKQRKKSRAANKSGLAMDKELKNMQILEEEKTKLDAFCEQSLKNAMTQERRRYGFVLERQCSLAKHYVSFHEVALSAFNPSLDEWRDVAATREYLPQSVEDMFASRLRQVSFWPEEEENGGSDLTMSSQLRKTRSMDSSCLELSRLGPPPQSQSTASGLHHGLNQNNHSSHVSTQMSRARSEANLHASTLSLGPEVPDTPPRPRSMVPVSRNSIALSSNLIAGGTGWGTEAPLARALFAYLSSGENQLSFHEGDLIALMGDRQKGWQFGENLRTQCSGWFPLAYTETATDESLGSPSHSSSNGRASNGFVDKSMPPCKPPPSRPPMPNGDDNHVNGEVNGHHNNSTNGNMPKSNSSHSIINASNGRQNKSHRPTGTLPSLLSGGSNGNSSGVSNGGMVGGGGRRVQPPVPPVPPPQGVTSLHSSNDSGFSNEPPVQPDIDYSDDEAMRLRRRKAAAKQQHHKQQQQSNINKADAMKQQNSINNKDWESDSWKSIPRNKENWQVYRSSMTEYWSDSNLLERKKEKSGRQGSNENKNTRNSKDDATIGMTKKERKQHQQQQHLEQKNEYENLRSVSKNSNNERGNNKYLPSEDQGNPERSYSRNRSDKNEEISRQEFETEDDEIEAEVDIEDEDEEEENYNAGMEYRSEKYENQKYYEGDEGLRNRSNEYGRRDNDAKYDNEKTSDSFSSESSESGDETLPETGRKVEQIAQKLEQTAQKYAREHSSPKCIERRSMNSSLDRSRDDIANASYDKYEHKDRNMRRTPQADENIDRYDSNSVMSSRQSTLVYEKKRPSHGFERPRPPSQEAPERPSDQSSKYRDMMKYPKEEIYGETTTMGFANDSVLVEKDRGYESNFETKMERSKILQRHGYPRNSRNDSNNNSLMKERKPLAPRQSSTMSSTMSVPASQLLRNFEFDNSPKLVKRTKSFWRFRRDSDVLEGMALWQHRSLVDIPKMLKKEEPKQARSKSIDKSSSEGSPGMSHRSLERKNSDETITDERINGPDHNEPKAAERMCSPERSSSEYYDESPTPAERSRMSDRNTEKFHSKHQDEYQAHPQQKQPQVKQQLHHQNHHRQQQQEQLIQERSFFVGNVSRRAILENERKRSMEASRQSITEVKDNQGKPQKQKQHMQDMMAMKNNRNELKKKNYGEDDDGLMINHRNDRNYTDIECSDEESTYSCIMIKDSSHEQLQKTQYLPRTKLRRDSTVSNEHVSDYSRSSKSKTAIGPWYDLWGADRSIPSTAVTKKKKKAKQQ